MYDRETGELMLPLHVHACIRASSKKGSATCTFVFYLVPLS